MFTPVDTRDAAAVEAAVQTAYREICPDGDADLVPRAFECAACFFRGGCLDFQAVDALYHDFEHTLQGTLCMVRLLANRHRAAVLPKLDQRLFKLGLLAILLHDTGYAKKQGDVSGTGAKYTFTHVARSAEFAAEILRSKGLPADDIHAVQNMIHCTGVNIDLAAIPFASEMERIVGYALGTGDLLGQMAAPDYVDKLPILFAEFEEATAFQGGHAPKEAGFKSLDELIQKTPAFWQHFVRVKIERDFQGLYRFLETPYPGGPNEYLERIEANIDRVRRLVRPTV